MSHESASGVTLHDLSDEALLADIATLVGSHRALTAKLVAHLAEIEERRLHLLSGYSSMFDFCQKKLGMGEGEAFRRILAARLSRRFPSVLSLLAYGAVNLSTLELVRDHLSAENHGELFAAVARKPKREVMKYLAARFPRPDKPSSIRSVASVEPLSEGRFKVEFTASEALCEKLERSRDLLSHANPSRDLGVVIERAVDLLLRELEKKRLGRTRAQRGGNSRVEKPREARSEAVQRDGRCHARELAPRACVARGVKRAVFERDGQQCTYVAADGRRCEASAFLELDHIDPKALGGSNDAANLRVRCRAHNQLWAEQSFGRERVERARHFCQKKSKRSPVGEDACVASIAERANQDAQARAAIFEKVHRALRGMGFRDGEARRAVAAVVRTLEPSEPVLLEVVLREAILFATAA